MNINDKIISQYAGFKEELAEIVGLEEVIEMEMMLELYGYADIPIYKIIPAGNPKQVTRDILNADAALSMGDRVSKETIQMAKEHIDTITRIFLFVLRRRHHTLEQIESEMEEVIRRFQGERIHIYGSKRYKSENAIYISDFLNRRYQLGCREIAKTLCKSAEQVRRYIIDAFAKPESIYRKRILEVEHTMDMQQQQLIEKQENKLYVRPKNRSKVYNVENLSKKNGEKAKLVKMKLPKLEK